MLVFGTRISRRSRRIRLLSACLEGLPLRLAGVRLLVQRLQARRLQGRVRVVLVEVSRSGHSVGEQVGLEVGLVFQELLARTRMRIILNACERCQIGWMLKM
jgi:hypothetical protein